MKSMQGPLPRTSRRFAMPNDIRGRGGALSATSHPGWPRHVVFPPGRWSVNFCNPPDTPINRIDSGALVGHTAVFRDAQRYKRTGRRPMFRRPLLVGLLAWYPHRAAEEVHVAAPQKPRQIKSIWASLPRTGRRFAMPNDIGGRAGALYATITPLLTSKDAVPDIRGGCVSTGMQC